MTDLRFFFPSSAFAMLCVALSVAVPSNCQVLLKSHKTYFLG